MASIVVKAAVLAFAGSFLESKYGPSPNTDGPLGLSTHAALTPLIFTGLCWWSLLYGFLVVNQARRDAIDQAKKDGETEVLERYGLPNLYAQGTSNAAKKFNCVQRSHQHMLETFTQAALTSTIASLHYPWAAAALNALLYAVGRVAASNGYANSEGDPSRRYAPAPAVYFWYGLIANFVLAMLSCVNALAGTKVLW